MPTKSQSKTTPFPPGLADEIIIQLPLSFRLHIFFCWAAEFASPTTENHHRRLQVTEIIASITKLDLQQYYSIATTQIGLQRLLQLGSLPLQIHYSPNTKRWFVRRGSRSSCPFAKIGRAQYQQQRHHQHNQTIPNQSPHHNQTPIVGNARYSCQ